MLWYVQLGSGLGYLGQGWRCWVLGTGVHQHRRPAPAYLLLVRPVRASRSGLDTSDLHSTPSPGRGRSRASQRGAHLQGCVLAAPASALCRDGILEPISPNTYCPPARAACQPANLPPYPSFAPPSGDFRCSSFHVPPKPNPRNIPSQEADRAHPPSTPVQTFSSGQNTDLNTDLWTANPSHLQRAAPLQAPVAGQGNHCRAIHSPAVPYLTARLIMIDAA